jgi:hypothetical protein
VLGEFKPDQTVKTPLLRKEGTKGWLNRESFLIPRCQEGVGKARLARNAKRLSGISSFGKSALGRSISSIDLTEAIRYR